MKQIDLPYRSSAKLKFDKIIQNIIEQLNDQKIEIKKLNLNLKKLIEEKKKLDDGIISKMHLMKVSLINKIQCKRQIYSQP